MSTFTQAVTQLYVAYFARPADPMGQQYWENAMTQQHSSLAEAANAFATSPEYLSLYSGMSSAAQINQIYMNLFGRAAEMSGLIFWNDHITQGHISLSNAVLEIANSARGTDLIAITDKVIGAAAFTAALDTTEEILGYSGTNTFALERARLATVVDEATLQDYLHNKPLFPITIVGPIVAEPHSGAAQLIDLTGQATTVHDNFFI